MARAADQPQTATPLQSSRSLLSRFSTTQLLQIAAAVFIISTLLAVRQFREPYRWHKPYPSESLSWWLRPLEWNIDAGLPQISGDINAVAMNRSADCLWIGGDSGLLAFSDDAGRTWLQLAYDPGSGAFRTPLQQSIPCGGNRSATTAALEWPSITFVARAATVEPRKPGEQPPGKLQPGASNTRQNYSQQNSQAQREDSAKVQGLKPNPAQQPNNGLQSSSASKVQSPPQATDILAMDFLRNQPALITGDLQEFEATNQGALWRLVQPGPSITGSETGIHFGDTTLYFRLDTTAGAAPSLVDIAAYRDTKSDSYRLGDRVTAVWFIDGKRGWAIKNLASSPPLAGSLPAFAGSQLLRTSDGGGHWSELSLWSHKLAARDRGLNSIYIAPDGRLGWVAGNNGVLLRTEDGGLSWLPATRSAIEFLNPDDAAPVTQAGTYNRFVPPWYLLALILTSLILSPLFKRLDTEKLGEEELEPSARSPQSVKVQTVKKSKGRISITSGAETSKVTHDVDPASVQISSASPEPSLTSRSAPDSGIPDRVISDNPLKPGDPDALNLRVIALSLSRLFRNVMTVPPLTVAINGKWGSGKSSLMNLLKADLESFGGRPVWFNAWHHQKEDVLLAALLQAVKQQAVPPLFDRRFFLFRWRLLRGRLWRYRLHFLVMIAVIAFIVLTESELHSRHYSVLAGIAHTMDHWFGKPADSAKQYSDAAEALRKLESSHQTSPASPQASSSSNSSLQTSPVPAAQDKILEEGAAYFARQAANLSKEVAKSSPWTIDEEGGYQDYHLVTWLALFASVVLAAMKGLVAFGSNPATLLATIAGSTKSKDLQAQTSFREKFATEFGEVTRALGMHQRLLILIDDLDRCRPEKVRDILEAVNFLVSNGQCFVALGMDREVVNAYLALNFGRVARGIPASLLGLSEDATAADKSSTFAHRYLDKLIQIDVDIPAPDAEQKKRLFWEIPLQETAQISEQRRAAERRVQPVQAFIGKSRASLAFLLLCAALAAIVYQGSHQLAVSISASEESVEASKKQLLAGDVSAQDSKSANDYRPDETRAVVQQGGSTGSPLLKPQQPKAAPYIVDAEKRNTSLWVKMWPFYAVLFFVGTAFTTLLTRKRGALVVPTNAFERALQLWGPLLIQGQNDTPRNAKRFQNRVRYLAMRLRTEHALARGNQSVSIGEELLRRMLAAWPPFSASQADPAAREIPGPVLVTLSAIHIYRREWIEDRQQFDNFVLNGGSDQITEPATTGVNVNEYRLVVESYKASYATFGQWSLLQDYYDTYRRIAAHPY